MKRFSLLGAACMLLGTPYFALAQTTAGGYWVEADGLVVIEAESIGSSPDWWRNASTATPPDLNLSGGAPSGGNFLTWEGSQSFGTPGVSTLVYPIQINNPGTYRFRWRSQTGSGTNTTEHNDTWLKIESDAFYAQKGSGGTIVCPKGFNASTNACIGGVPNGGGAAGWFKVYTSGANTWRWTANTSDNDAHQVYVRFDRAGIYAVQLSARSSFHIVDRMVLSSSAFAGNPENLDLPESQFIADDSPSTPPPGPMPDNPLTVDASGQWFERKTSGEPVFMSGMGGPEGFLFETDARKQEIVSKLIAQDVNALYFHSIRSFQGDGYDFEDPFVTHQDVTSAVDTAVLDNWRSFLDQLDNNDIISWFHILDDTARPWGCSVPLSGDATRYIATIVNRFKDLDNLVWLAGEEFLMGSCSAAEDRALMRAIAAEIRLHDPVHPIGVHHNNGQAMQFNLSDEPVINVFAQQICGNSAVRNPDGIHAAAERGDFVYVMAECHPWHLQLLHNNDRRMLRLSNWATAMAGGYVLMYNAYECQETGKLCSLDSAGNPVSANDPHDPSDAMLADLRRLRQFMEASRFSELNPADARARGDTDWVLANDSAGIWIVYSKSTPTSMGVSGLGNVALQLRWYNPATGAQVLQNAMSTASPFPVPASLGEDVALFIERSGAAPEPEPATINLALVDAGTNTTVQPLVNGSELVIPVLGFSSWSAVATNVPIGTASVSFVLSGQQSGNQTENQSPYALFGDTNGDFEGRPLEPGVYTVAAKAHSGAGGGGTVLASVTVNFTLLADSPGPPELVFRDGFEESPAATSANGHPAN